MDLYPYASAIFLANAQRMRVLGAADLAASHIHKLQGFHGHHRGFGFTFRLGPEDASIFEN